MLPGDRRNASCVVLSFLQKRPYAVVMRRSHYLQSGQEREVGNPELKRKGLIMKSNLQMDEKKKLFQKDPHPLCFRCGRKLKSKESQELGMGPVCYRKWQTEKDTIPLFEENVK
jgi:hypothetical protein